MEEVFLKIMSMSISACWIILVVIAARFILAKAPKWIRVVMWGIAGIRLICPFSFESVLSLIPSDTIYNMDSLNADGGIHNVVDNQLSNQPITPVVPNEIVPAVEQSAGTAQNTVLAASVVWIIGVAVLMAYMCISFFRIHRRVREAALYKENIWLCDRIDTPFVLGVFRPEIFLPSSMNKEDMGYVIAHEQAHLKRCDHWWKPLGFVILAIHWFNPLVWAAYMLLCRDIEFACDEKVIRQLGASDRKAYSTALVNCSVPSKAISACPLAFGEVGIKARIKAVLNYKKPAFWIVLAAVILCVAVAVCFLTNPKKSDNSNESDSMISEDSANASQTFEKEDESLSTTSSDDSAIYYSDVETVKEIYRNQERTVFDAQIIDLDFDGKNELLVLTHLANPKVLEVWEKNGGEMKLTSSFGAGKVNWINDISLWEKTTADGKRMFLFSFTFGGENSMTAEVLSAIVKTANGYDVEHLLSCGTITYSDIAEPFTKVFFRKGWSKFDVGMNGDFGDITQEEYIAMYKYYTGVEPVKMP